MNIREFAALCGVSASTVSRILNKTQEESRASLATYEEVRKKAVELGFRPHYAAKILHTHKSNCIGLIVGYPTMLNTTALIRGVSNITSQNGMSVAITGCKNNPRLEKKAFDDMLYRGVDGIVWHPAFQRYKSNFAYIQKTLETVVKKIPVVCINYNSLPGIFKFKPNGEEDAIQAALRQIRMQCRKFAIVRSVYERPSNWSNKNAYYAELLRHGIEPADIVEITLNDPGNPPDWSVLSGVQGMWFSYLFMLHSLVPQLAQYCDLKQLHIDGQSFIEDYSLTQWTSIQSPGCRFEDLFGSLQYHLLHGLKIAERATEIAIQAINNPNLEPFEEPLVWEAPPPNFSPKEVLFDTM